VVKIYTRTGDDGETSLFGGARVGKGDDRLEAYGSLDELNAYLGWFRSVARERDLSDLVLTVQPALFDLGAHLATPSEAEKARRILPPFREERVKALEEAIDRLEAELSPLTAFILPGGTEESAILQVARAVCRRGERAVVRAVHAHGVPLPPAGLAYLNRLSDLLFVMARVVNRRKGGAETPWTPERPAS
jgi:cob(I)alamin adenosyltransferase